MQVERVGGKDVYQAIKGATIAHAPPETFVLGREFVCCPYSEGNFDGKDDGGEIVDHFEPSAVAGDYVVVGGEKDLQCREQNQTYDGIIHYVLPLLGVQIVIKDAPQIVLKTADCLRYVVCVFHLQFRMQR